YFLAATLFQIPAGVIFDRFGLTRTIPPMLILASVGALIVALSGTGWELIAGRLLMGIGCGAVTTGGVVLCSKWVGPSRFTSVVASLYALSQLGYLGSTTPMAVLAERIGWRGSFLVMAGGALLLALAHIVLIRETLAQAAGTREATPGLRETVLGSL